LVGRAYFGSGIGEEENESMRRVWRSKNKKV